MSIPQQSVPEQGGANEIDNHADTICAGPNWKLIELSGEYCNGSPFSADYKPKTNVPIARKCAATYTCPESCGKSVVLVADQVLWFGNELHCSLINPHHIRSHGDSVCDDPWDPNQSLGLDLEGIFIPLDLSGPNLFFESRVPTDWEMDNLPIIELTTPVWNPADLQMFRPHSHLKCVLVNCISTASRDIWSESATHLSAISPSLDSRCVLALYVSQILVRDAPTGTRSECRDRCNAYERTAFIRYIQELEPKMEHWIRDCKTNITGYNATRRSNRGASTASAIPSGSSTPKPAKTKQK